MASDALFLALSQALSRPSHALRAAQAGGQAGEDILGGYRAGQGWGDEMRKRELSQTPLSEAFGGKTIPGLENFGDTSVEGMTTLAPAITAGAALEKANREPLIHERNDSLENILAENVRTGKMTMEQAAEVKRSMSPSNTIKPPPGFQFAADGSLIPIPGGDPALKRQEDASKKQREKQSSLESAKTVVGKIDQALTGVGPSTSGFVGSVTRGIAGTPSANLNETLNTVRANVGFETLQAMRVNSPTGGALGQVSDMENKLLQAVRGSLDQKQTPEQLAGNLKSLRNHYSNVILAIESQTGDPEADNAIAKVISSSANENEKRARIQGIRSAAGAQ